MIDVKIADIQTTLWLVYVHIFSYDIYNDMILIVMIFILHFILFITSILKWSNMNEYCNKIPDFHVVPYGREDICT